MKRAGLLFAMLLALGCGRSEPAGKGGLAGGSLLQARQGFQTKLVRQEAEHEAADEPPPQLFRSVRYDSPTGKLVAYLSLSPRDGQKHPAILWLFGGFSNSIGDTAWKAAPAKNDQSASAFRKAGIRMMYPSLRGGNDNPGFKEAFFGEVDDVLAAADYLSRQDGVDPGQIYLGGHSTGGTLALLAAACSDRFRAVFSLGPVDNVAGYGADNLPFDLSNPRELELRAPRLWMQSIQSPAFLFEGDKRGNLQSLQILARAAASNPRVHCYTVKGGDHFSILAPLTRLLANKVLLDEGPTTNIAVTQEELNSLFAQ